MGTIFAVLAFAVAAFVTNAVRRALSLSASSRDFPIAHIALYKTPFAIGKSRLQLSFSKTGIAGLECRRQPAFSSLWLNRPENQKRWLVPATFNDKRHTQSGGFLTGANRSFVAEWIIGVNKFITVIGPLCRASSWLIEQVSR